MNPAGLRLDEKKTADDNDYGVSSPPDVTGTASYKSTHSSRSSVLERAREYNRRIEQSDLLTGRDGSSYPADAASTSSSQQRRAKSLDRGRRSGGAGNHRGGASGTTPRSGTSNNTARSSSQQPGSTRHPHYRGNSQGAAHQPSPRSRSAGASPRQPRTASSRERASSRQNEHHHPLPTIASSSSKRNTTPPQQQSYPDGSSSRQQQQQSSRGGGRKSGQAMTKQHHAASSKSIGSNPQQRLSRSPSASQKQQQQQQRPTAAAPAAQQQQEEAAVVTPELLVDALSGQEEGLLAIAERLMEHYDGGYDSMGEALIDAFADVQKLFQHVVEAAHMEGAAFEASRRDEEARERAGAGTLGDPILAYSQDTGDPSSPPAPASPAGPNRHDEFIDQDVKDVLTDAIRKGSALRDKSGGGGKDQVDQECYQLYVQACQSASALLPVDSDHRGRLQLSLARGESMSPERACAILRYAMDDVLRSGMRAHNTPLPDHSQRADMVLDAQQAGGTQRAEEALASLMEEMKEVMSAPVYKDTPLQAVAQRFWTALAEQQKSQHKNEERLEQNLAKLKGDFLLARAEWEEKLTRSQEHAESYKTKYERLKEQMKGEDYMEQARNFASRLGESRTDESASSANQTSSDLRSMYGSVKSATANRAPSVASLGSGLAQHAKTLVNSMKDFNCNAPNMSSTTTGDDQKGSKEEPYYSGGGQRESRSRSSPRYGGGEQQQRSRSTGSRTKTSRSYREYSRSPQRVDV